MINLNHNSCKTISPELMKLKRKVANECNQILANERRQFAL